MTVLGAVVFGGFLALGVLWLLITAPSSDVDDAWRDSVRRDRPNWDEASASASCHWALTHSLRE